VSSVEYCIGKYTFERISPTIIANHSDIDVRRVLDSVYSDRAARVGLLG